MTVPYDGALEFGLDLTREQVDQFDLYYHQLVGWNARINLTAITEYTQVLVKHFLDSLSVALALPRPFETNLQGRKLIDVGAGAGFPGVPLAIAFPQLQVTLLEATGKKAIFLDQLGRVLNLANVTVLRGRAEELGQKPEYREQFDFAAARAVAELRSLVELTLPFVRLGGVLIAQKSLDVQAEAEAAADAIQALGGTRREIIPVQLPDVPESRYLVVIEKIGATPEKYPRRAGMPEKRPL